MLGVWLLAFLSACSGSASTGDTGSGSGGTTPVVKPASVTLLVSSPQLNSDNKTNVTLTAVVKDANNVGIKDQTVVFTASSGLLTVASNITDATGVVTATLSTGGDPSNRDINLTASSGGVTVTNLVTVSGTAIQVSGSSSLVFGSTTDLTINVKDSAGTSIPKAQISITSAQGNGLSANSVVADGTGQAKITVNATKAGDDTITVTSSGASKVYKLSVSGSDFKFTQPAADSNVNIGSTQSVSIKWLENGVPQVGKPISFSATRGAVSATSVATDSDGVATVSVSSTESGPSIVTATAAGGTPSNAVALSFVAITASRVEVQADRTTLAVFKAGNTNSVASISAIVRDANNNLVQNAKVVFSMVADPSGGKLNTSVGTTDSAGTATVQYTAGSISSGQNAVQIKAEVADVGGVVVPAGINNTLAMTVGGQSLFVRIGTDNKVTPGTGTYTKLWVAKVTDSAGNAVPGVTVQFRLRPRDNSKGFAYAKGVWQVFDGLTPPWGQVVSATCDNEDINFNGILDVGEDKNGSGNLTPGNVAGVSGNATTDDNGFAQGLVSYPKSFANWAAVTIRAVVMVSGSEFWDEASFVLPILAEDVADKAVHPPGRISPFGTSSSCADAL